MSKSGKQSKTPPQIWYKAMDKIHSEKFVKHVQADLDANPNLLKALGPYKDRFVEWAAIQRVNYHPNIKEEVSEFLENRGKRMFHKDVKGWYRLIKAVFKRDNYTCQYCGKVGGNLEADHIRPFSKGGKDELENLTTACIKCNRQKRDKTVEDFLKWRESNA